MPNNYFRFKQFTVYQEWCAMKVCTDACLFGAWAAVNVAGKRILDIGAGTGLLSLMLAQKSDAAIDAIETDEQAYRQAAENFAASPWATRLKAVRSRIQDFSDDNKYDVIISNPPFFDNDLRSGDAQRNLALHSADLDLNELLMSVNRLLSDNGKFAVLLPFHRSEYFEKLACEEQFDIERKVLVKQTPMHSYFRVMYLLSGAAPRICKGEGSLQKMDSIVIKDQTQYTQPFADLLKDYYL